MFYNILKGFTVQFFINSNSIFLNSHSLTSDMESMKILLFSSFLATALLKNCLIGSTNNTVKSSNNCGGNLFKRLVTSLSRVISESCSTLDGINVS